MLLDGTQHEAYLKNTAGVVSPPPRLALLLNVLACRAPDEELLAPTQRGHLLPFLVPLSRNTRTGRVTALLRWPTPPDEMPLPIVRTNPVPNDGAQGGAAVNGDDRRRRHRRGQRQRQHYGRGLGVELAANSVDQFLHRDVATRDARGDDIDGRHAADDAEADAIARVRPPQSIYRTGAVHEFGHGLERYLALHAGAFPDVYERLAEHHLAKGDSESALVAMERASSLFKGWARSHCYRAVLLQRLGRVQEARDAARLALQLPLWTIGPHDSLASVAALAGYREPDSLARIYRRLADDERREEVAQGGKSAEQVALDRAAFTLDAVIAEADCGSNGNDEDGDEEEEDWETVRERLATLYEEARMPQLAYFVRS